MALRVLLADESSTIKKVMQLALSDFAVDVKAVPVGLDVLTVAKSFKPDLVFADVLLSKRSGYEVCSDLKADPETSHIPVVLMWSGFMEIDEEKASGCQADRRLEKPFDAEGLRRIVNELVQKTRSNPISSFLNFPDMPEFEEISEIPTVPEQEHTPPPQPSQIRSSSLDLPEIENPDVIPLEVVDEDFAAAPLAEPQPVEEPDEGGWTRQDLTKFKLNIPESESVDFASKFVIPQDEDLSNLQVEESGNFEEITFAKPGKSPAPTADAFASKVEKTVKEQMMETLQKSSTRPASSDPTVKGTNAQPNLQSNVDINANMVEKVIREEAREVIESICWKVIPEIAERVVREQINKILKETEI